MTPEEVFCDLFDKYGDRFNWIMIPFTQGRGSLVEELKREIGSGHFLYDKMIYAVAKCESNDDVLYVTGSETGADIYYIFHLTYSNGAPRCIELADVFAGKEYLEKECEENYM